ncbi:MAG: hypothetical protein ACYTG2_09500 [Planctomycetota bacterium]|jgi:hypothetical protein
MPCVIVLLLLGTPRLAIFLTFLFSDYLGRAYESNFWPFLGFFFMPLTTLAYAWSINTWGQVEGVGLAACVIAALLDLGVLGASRRRHPAEG